MRRGFARSEGRGGTPGHGPGHGRVARGVHRSPAHGREPGCPQAALSPSLRRHWGGSFQRRSQALLLGPHPRSPGSPPSLSRSLPALGGMEAPPVEGSFLSVLDSGEDRAKRGQLAPAPSSGWSQARWPGPAWRAMALSLSPQEAKACIPCVLASLAPSTTGRPLRSRPPPPGPAVPGSVGALPSFACLKRPTP